MFFLGHVWLWPDWAALLQSTFAAGQQSPGHIRRETPTVQDVTIGREVVFDGARAVNVTFGYGEETVLSDISIDLQKNQVVGIVGRAAAAKSTLLKLFIEVLGGRKRTNRNIGSRYRRYKYR